MTTTEYLLNIGILALVLATNLGTRTLTWRRLMVPVLLVALAGSSFLRQMPTLGHDLELELAGLSCGVLLGVVAALLAIIPLYLISLYASYGGTYLVTTKFFGLSPGVYNHYFHLYLPFIDVIYSLAKACVFAVAVTLIHCYYGFYASGGPEGVGVAVGRAIRLSIVTVVVLNLILSLVFWGGGNTVRVAG